MAPSAQSEKRKDVIFALVITNSCSKDLDLCPARLSLGRLLLGQNFDREMEILGVILTIREANRSQFPPLVSFFRLEI